VRYAGIGVGIVKLNTKLVSVNIGPGISSTAITHNTYINTVLKVISKVNMELVVFLRFAQLYSELVHPLMIGQTFHIFLNSI